MNLTLQNPKLRLRPYTSDDADFLYTLFSESRAMTFYPEEVIRRLANQWLNEQQEAYIRHGYGVWVMETPSGDPVGQCGFMRRLIRREQAVEMGFSVLRTWRGRGFASRAARMAMERARRQAIAPVVYALTDPDNDIARRILIKCGFRRDGEMERHGSNVPLFRYDFKTEERAS
ncbi:MAG: N-acetyltransferase [Calditrichaeota bacterium]|nr:MAG: N-acetyltransferase [Calditrichota bacterium]